MKTQSTGRGPFNYLLLLPPTTPRHLLFNLSNALKNYRENAENGSPDESPGQFPTAGFDDLDVENVNSQSGKYPDARGRYWWKLTLKNGDVVNDFYWMQDEQRGFPEKDHKGNERYWYSVHHAPSGTTIEGFCWQPDDEKGYPDGKRKYWSYVEFDDKHCPAIRQWMDKKDRHYLRRLRCEANIDTTDFEDALAKISIPNSQLTTLNFHNYALGDDHVLKLLERLKTNARITELNLGGNDISPACIPRLTELLGTKTSRLIKIDLGFNDIDDEGANRLLAALSKNTVLMELNLNYNLTTDASLAMRQKIESILAANRSLSRALFEAAQNGDKKAIVNLLEKGVKLFVTDIQCDFGEKNAKTALAYYVTPGGKFDLSDAQLTDRCITKIIECIESLPDMTELDLSKNLFTDDATMQLSRAIANHPNLTKVTMSHNGLGHFGVKELLKAGLENKKLIQLDVSNNYVYSNKEGLEELKTKQQQTGIQRLDMTNNYLQVQSKDWEKHWQHPKTFFHSNCSVAKQNITCYSSVISEQSVSYDDWLVYLFRDAAPGKDSEHAMLLIEGIKRCGQRFLEVSDFRPGCQELGGVRGDVKALQKWDPDRLCKGTASWHYNLYSITRLKGKQLQKNIKGDVNKTLFYGSKGISSKGRIYNCYTWALAKLRETGIILPHEEPKLLAIPSWQLRGRSVVDVPKKQETEPVEFFKGCSIS